jgi:hypothetical protein
MIEYLGYGLSDNGRWYDGWLINGHCIYIYRDTFEVGNEDDE